MAQVSAEVRWFILDGSNDEIAAVDRWFKDGPNPPGGGSERFDVYLIDHSTAELGIKARDGKPGLEVKVLVDANAATLSLGGRAAHVQVWSKVASAALLLPDERDKLRTTSKRRWLRKFDTLKPDAREILLGGGKSGEEPLKDAIPDVGCNVEWTTVEVDGQGWRTLGFESFAFNHANGYLTLVPSLERTFRTLEQTLGQLPPLGIGWNELSYPAWLRQP